MFNKRSENTGKENKFLYYWDRYTCLILHKEINLDWISDNI